MQLIPGLLTTVDTTATVTPGQTFTDQYGRVYIYAKGIASTAVGSWVRLTLSSDLMITALLTETLAALGGIVGVAMSASVDNTYGWYQIFGTAEASFLVSAATNVTLFATTTGGSLDDAGTTRIHGVWLEDTEGGSGTSNLTCFLSYPHCNKVA
jgi:hypothetical protein